jgi:hypothetical protein
LYSEEEDLLGMGKTGFEEKRRLGAIVLYIYDPTNKDFFSY